MFFLNIVIPLLSVFFNPDIAKAIVAHTNLVDTASPYLLILGTVQDGGSPHIGCQRQCCKELFTQPDPRRKVVSLGLIDPQHNKRYLLEATPDLPAQMVMLMHTGDFVSARTPDGIFLTHAHIGHYSGLMYLGKEAMHADRVPVYVMPRMREFLQENGPWSLLVSQHNVTLHSLTHQNAVQLTSNLRIIPFTVPHRDEFSETVGYLIEGPHKRALFIPDIDKWEKWETSIIEAIADVDYALIDGTFYDAAEINDRDISEIPHPFITESMALFEHLPIEEKQKLYFIHLNHTNPALDELSKQTEEILKRGFKVARMGDVVRL